MPNLTLAISEELYTKMKEHTEIRWSEVVRKSIAEKIGLLDVMNKLTKKSKLSQNDVDAIAMKIDGAVARKLGLK